MKPTHRLLLATTAAAALLGFVTAASFADAPRKGHEARAEAVSGGEHDARHKSGYRVAGRHDHDDDDDDDDDDEDGGNARRRAIQAPGQMAPVAPPNNGLFGNGAPPRVQVN